MLVFHDLTESVKCHKIAAFEPQSLPEDPLVSQWRQTEQIMHFLVLVEIKEALLVDEQVVGFSQRVEVIELVEVNKLIELFCLDFARLVIAFLDQAYFELTAEHFLHEFAQLATIYCLALSITILDKVDCLHDVFLFDIEVVLRFGFYLQAELLIMFQ